MNPEPGRRIAAARELAGYTSVDAFAEYLSASGFSASTLRNYESGRDAPPDSKVREFARLVGLPYDFFVIDFASLVHEPDDARMTSAELEINALQVQLTWLDRALRSLVTQMPEALAEADEDVRSYFATQQQTESQDADTEQPDQETGA